MNFYGRRRRLLKVIACEKTTFDETIGIVAAVRSFDSAARGVQ